MSDLTKSNTFRNSLQEAKAKRVAAYAASPALCTACRGPLPYENRAGKFCSRSCSVAMNNSLSPKKKKKVVEVRTCLMCEKALLRHQKSFCSRACTVKSIIERAEARGLGPTSQARGFKRKLIAEHGEICMDADCAWDFTKRKVRVEIHHVDGDSLNNTASNFVLLCPGCHSLTPTYGSKNKGNGRHERRKKALLEAHGVTL